MYRIVTLTNNRLNSVYLSVFTVEIVALLESNNLGANVRLTDLGDAIFRRQIPSRAGEVECDSTE